MRYIVEQLGDIGGKDEFDTLAEALTFIEKNICPDLEDDRILVWEVLPTGHRKVVWHFSGWHWDHNAEDVVPGGLEQGKLVGHEKCLEQELWEEY